VWGRTSVGLCLDCAIHRDTPNEGEDIAEATGVVDDTLVSAAYVAASSSSAGCLLLVYLKGYEVRGQVLGVWAYGLWLRV
jgi:hypothetical protein